MTIRVCISGAASKWQTPQSPEYHFSSDPCFRVPPTGIPKPEPDEVPQAHRWRDRLAGFACAMVLAFGAGNKSPDEPVITAGMLLQVDILGGKRTVMNCIMTPIQKSLATAFREK